MDRLAELAADFKLICFNLCNCFGVHQRWSWKIKQDIQLCCQNGCCVFSYRISVVTPPALRLARPHGSFLKLMTNTGAENYEEPRPGTTVPLQPPWPPESEELQILKPKPRPKTPLHCHKVPKASTIHCSRKRCTQPSARRSQS